MTYYCRSRCGESQPESPHCTISGTWKKNTCTTLFQDPSASSSCPYHSLIDTLQVDLYHSASYTPEVLLATHQPLPSLLLTEHGQCILVSLALGKAASTQQGPQCSRGWTDSRKSDLNTHGVHTSAPPPITCPHPMQ